MQTLRFILRFLFLLDANASFYDFSFYWMQTLRLRLHPIKSSVLLRILLDAKASPAVFPPSKRKTVLRKSKEPMKKYRNPRIRMILTKNKASQLLASLHPIKSSVILKILLDANASFCFTIFVFIGCKRSVCVCIQ